MEMISVPALEGLSAYERAALREIHLWKHPEATWFSRATDGVNRALFQATDLIRKVPGVDWTINNVVAGGLQVVNEIMQDSVWREAVYAEYHRMGHAAGTPEDLRDLDLQTIDGALRGLDAKYRALAAAEGAATGYLGLPGIAPDVVALVALNLRAVGEYATYCGFDVRDPAERLYALEILNLVSHPSDTAKQVTLAPVIRVTQHVARQQTMQNVQEFALTRAIRNAVSALGVRLTRAKLAQILPVAGALVGSGFNAYYTSKVCDAAFFLYRERFLKRKAE
ncbi:MAG: EcsC family protein [Rhodothermales bacterium]